MHSFMYAYHALMVYVPAPFTFSLGEGCSHVAAILFKIEAAKRNGYTATTSSSCRWNEVFTTKVGYICFIHACSLYSFICI